MLKTSSLSALLLVAAACAMPSGSAMAKEIVLGASVQLTGPLASTGRHYRDAYQLAIDKINLALKLYDNQSDAGMQNALQGYHREAVLARDNACAGRPLRPYPADIVPR